MIQFSTFQQQQLSSICRKHSVTNLFLFGSATSAAFSPSSDMDFAVLFSEELSPLEHGEAFFALKDELEALYERPVDLISYRVVSNPVFKRELDETKVELYAA